MSLIEALFDAELHIGSATILWARDHRKRVRNRLRDRGRATLGMGVARRYSRKCLVVHGVHGRTFPHSRKSSISTARPAVSCCSSPSASTGGLSGDAGHADSGRAVLPHWATNSRARRHDRRHDQRHNRLSPGSFDLLGSYGAWAEAWIFTGSILATYGMARALDRILAHLDRRRRRWCSASFPSRLLPFGDPLSGLCILRTVGLRNVAAHSTPNSTRGVTVNQLLVCLRRLSKPAVCLRASGAKQWKTRILTE